MANQIKLNDSERTVLEQCLKGLFRKQKDERFRYIGMALETKDKEERREFNRLAEQRYYEMGATDTLLWKIWRGSKRQYKKGDIFSLIN